MRPTWLLAAFALSASAAAQCGETPFTPGDLGPAASFGQSVAIDGDVAVAGAAGQGWNNLTAAGSVYVFERGAGGWSQTQKLRAGDILAGARFGRNVRVCGDWLAIAAPSHSEVGWSGGAVYLFERTPGGWVERQKLKTIAPLQDQRLGTAIALEAGRLVASTVIGNVHVFELQGDLWVETQTLSSAYNGVAFGERVALSGDRLAVTIFGIVQPFIVIVRFVEIFELAGGVWSSVDRVVPLTMNDTSSFAEGLALEDDRLYVGVPEGQAQGDAGRGRARVFVHDAGVWELEQNLISADGEAQDRFGTALDVENGTVVVGAAIIGPGSVNPGSAYVFERQLGSLNETRTVEASAPHPVGRYGESVGVSGQSVIVGAPRTTATAQFSGAVYIYDGAPPAVERYCTASPNSTGAAARIEVSGSRSIGASDLELVCDDVPNQNGLFIYARDPAATPVGNGTLCVGGGTVYRLPAETAVGNRLTHALDFNAPPHASGQITAGSTWSFSCWFRDPNVGVGFNFSDALTLTFCP